MPRGRLFAVAAAVLLSSHAACADNGAGSGSPAPRPGSVAAPQSGVTGESGAAGESMLLAAGDIASCSSQGDEATAALLDRRPGTVATLGDNAYPDGSPSDFSRCYEPSWGRHKARIRPALGNHEYRTAGASGYFDYFGANAGDRRGGYYSFQLGAWHVIVLNSNCAEVSCQAGSPQERWLRADVDAHRAGCTLAYWHHPRFSSGDHGSSEDVAPLFTALYQGGADLVLAGHDHDYERFAPLDPAGRVDHARGIRTFVVGTGGASLRPIERPMPASEAHSSDTFGILALTLRADGYHWEFVPQAGRTFTDTGSGACH